VGLTAPRADPERVVVVGGGLAATRTIEELRRLGSTARITLIGAEEHLPYDRPPLTKDVLRGERDDTALREDWSALDVDLRLGRRAVALHADRCGVLLDDGEEVPSDAVVVATGAAARRLPGLTGSGVHVVRTVDDALALRRDVAEHRRLTVVGGGFIGCEAAASAVALGARVTLVEVLPAPLARVLGNRVAREVAALHAAAGVDLRCGVSVVEARGTDEGRELLLSDGSVVDATVVLVGIGVLPEAGWLAGSGITVDDGVLCDSSGRTSVPGVWAAGDVSRWVQPRSGTHRRVEHWTSAADQGVAVARDIVGQGVPLDEVPYFWSDQYATKLQVLGSPHPDDDVTLLRVGPAGDRMLGVYGREGVVTGVVGANAARWVMRMRPLIGAGTPYDEALEFARP
jgi:3-phenylpropionate/trans-cinnamate dioxygenase ferredoxin reductase component